MLKILINFFILILFKNCNSNIIDDEIKCLNNLPITQLIKIHKSLTTFEQCSINELHDIKNNVAINSEILNNDSIESRILVNNNNNNDNKLKPLPLMGLNNFFKNTFSFNNKNKLSPLQDLERSDEHWEHEKPTKLTKIFQGSITALSFLAFGAYLLCMIVQAIKSKGSTYYYPVSTVQPFTGITPVKRIKIFRRTKRATTTNQRKNLLKIRNLSRKALLSNNTFHKSNNSKSSEFYNDIALPDPEEMYKILEQFAEGYVKIATIM